MRPEAMVLFAWEAGWVFTLRSLRLATQPSPEAAESLASMIAEKQQAFTEGALAAGKAMLDGSRPDVVAAAALRPSRRRVSANLRALRKGG
jgi:hypothetical protein